MLRIHLNNLGLDSVHMMATLGPMSEGIFSVRHAGDKGEPVFKEWRKQLGARVKTSAAVAETLLTLRRASDLTWLLAPAEHHPASDRIRAASLGWSEIRAAMEEFTQLSIMPYWQQILSYLVEQREERLRHRPDGGESLLNYLHPDIHWDGRVLEIQGMEDVDVESDSNGLLVAPSLFLGDRPAVLLRNLRGTNGRPVLVFSAQPTPAVARGLWSPQPKDGEALDALMGRTRAQLLRLTLTGGTTSELARRVGTSAAAVSQHTSVLRRAGLIESERHRNTVNHRITSLGRAVLDGLPLAPEPPNGHQPLLRNGVPTQRRPHSAARDELLARCAS